MDSTRTWTDGHYRQLLDTVPHIVWITDAAGSVQYMNRPGIDLLGVPENRVQGWGWLEALHPEDAERSRKLWEKCVLEGTPYRNKYRVRSKQGVYHWYLSQGVPLHDAQGQAVRWIGTWTDIDDHIHAEHALRESEERYRLLLENIPNPLFVYDHENLQLLSVNQAALEHYGYSREQFLQMKVTDLHPPEDQGDVAKMLMEQTGNQALVGDWHHLQKNGGRIDVELSVRTLEIDGRTTRVLLAQDVTQRRQAEAELSQTGNLLRAVAEGTTDAIFVKDLEGRYLLINPAAQAFIGRPAREIVGRDDSELFGPDEAHIIRNSDQKVMRSGTVQTQEEVLTQAGITRTFLAIKAPFRDAHGKIAGLIGISRDITYRKQAEEVLRLRDRAIQAVSQAIVITDPTQPDNPITWVSPSFETITGYPIGEVLHKNPRLLQGPLTDPETVRQLREAIHQERPCTFEMLNYRKDGSTFWNALSVSPVRDERGWLTHFIGVQADVTERRKLEEQLRQAVKMEAVGQLAGGVAHDFNNMLTIINCYSEMLLQSNRIDMPVREKLEEIRKAGERSALLTQQLLAFSRKQLLTPKLINLNDVVTRVEQLLNRLIGEDIQLVTDLDPALENVRADPGQIEQVLLNLAGNARDAMPQGGMLKLETKNARSAPQPTEENPLGWVIIAITDTGVGMSEEVRQKIFEPFFTTKAANKSTGLGLSVVQGIVEQSGGQIDVASQRGKGATFQIYLPALSAAAEAIRDDFAPPLGGKETILLVEDEDAVRALTRHILEQYGYNVIEAMHGEAAVQTCAAYLGSIDLLLTDVVMPGLGGRKLVERLLLLHPEMKVLYVSGYTDDAVIRHGIQQEEVDFLQKPFSPVALTHKVREVLDR